MNGAALIIGSVTVSRNGLFGALGGLCAVLATLGFWQRKGKRAAELLAFFPLGALFGLLLARAAHWFSHPLNYEGLLPALAGLWEGGFSLWGAVVGVLLAAGLCAGAGFVSDLPVLLDALSPAAALGIAVGRLGSLYDLSDRGKILVTAPFFQRLPFAALTEVSGAAEWRLATFCLQSLFCLALFLRLGHLELRGREERGSVCARFALFYGLGQILLDSTRFDADFLRFNGFVHMPQLLSAVLVAGAMVWLGLKNRQLRPGRRALVWGLTAALLGVCGGMEYLLQRRPYWQGIAYAVMATALAGIGALGLWLRAGTKEDKNSRIRLSIGRNRGITENNAEIRKDEHEL